MGSREFDKPFVSKIKFEFTQEGNTLGTTHDFENLVVYVESQCGNIEEKEDDPFYVIKTSTGWSIDSIPELDEVLRTVKETVEDLRRKKDV
jgi:hypothetical protein